VRAVCRRVDGLPLAIEIVASRVRSVSVRDMADGLGFTLRTTGALDAPDRHRTLAAAIEWGAGILDAPLRRLHAELGVFQSRFTPEAASFAFGATYDDIDALVGASLLRRVDDGGVTRLAMLQTVREFARERLAEDNRIDDARERRAAWIEDLAARAAVGLTDDDPAVWLRELEHWAPDIRATLREAVLAVRSCRPLSRRPRPTTTRSGPARHGRSPGSRSRRAIRSVPAHLCSRPWPSTAGPGRRVRRPLR
jgi:predicted ATPase